MTSSFLKIFVALSIALLVFSPNENNVEAAVCERRSKIFSGFCGDNDECDATCLREGAFQGSCHVDGLGVACFCFFNC